MATTALHLNPSLSRVNEDSTRAELLEAFNHATATARRTPAFDHLSRPSRDYDTLHAYLDYLLDLWLIHG